MIAKKTTKNQLTLPKDIVKEFPGIEYFDASIVDRRIVLIPLRVTHADTLENVRQKLFKLGVTETDVTDAVRWARKRKP